MVAAIIVAAGSSRRMGFDKLFAPLDGRPVVAHSLRAFHQVPEVSRIIVVCREERLAEMEAMLKKEKLTGVVRLTVGGAERHLSVWNGLQQVDAGGTSFVAIHDGARPLVTPELIGDCLALAQEHGAACCATPIPDTVKRASVEQMVTESVERTGLWAMQTPQIFSSSLILQAYAAVVAKNEAVTDEVTAIQKLGTKVALLRHETPNLKITYPHDLELAEHILKLRARKRRKGRKAGGEKSA